MSDQDGNIFNNEQQQQGNASETPAAVPEAPAVPDYLSSLVGDGKKYGSVENAMKSIPSAQDHIGRLEQENSDLRDSLAKAEDLQAVVANNLQQPTSNEYQQAAVTPEAPADINAMIDDRMNARTAQEKATGNIRAVDAAMKEKFGDKAKDMLALKATELGVSGQFLQDTAQQSPKAFLSLFGMSDQTSAAVTTATSQSTLNTEAMGNQHQGVKPGTHAYYTELRNSDRKAYFSQKVQAQMNKDMMQPGFMT
jgi:hypothetical protein